MKIITDLSPAARANLIQFCASNLKVDYDAERYADGLIEAADLNDAAHFEIRGFHTKTGNPVTTGYGQDGDFVFSEIDEDGNVIG